MSSFTEYKHKGVRALVILHEKHLRSFYETWKKAKELNIELPETDDPDYENLETLLRHPLRSARGYLTWICEKLNLDDPQINEPPEVENITKQALPYLEHLLGQWKKPLKNVTSEQLDNQAYQSRWGAKLTIESMLEHAVIHPIRHEFQLLDLITKKMKAYEKSIH